MQVRGPILGAALALLPAAQSVHAQTADLRYGELLPPSVVFITIDSATSTADDLPGGDMITTSYLRTVSQLTFAPAQDGMNVTAVIRELDGNFSSPMGNMPISANDIEPVEMRMNESGPDAAAVAADLAAATMGSSPGSLIGSARAFAGLLAVPGRELRLGDTWVDTVRATPALEGFETDMLIVTHGTYAADSVLDGRIVNVLRITTETTTKLQGTLQGMRITQDMTSTAEERVLWDSSLHLPVSREGAGTMRAEMTAPAMGRTMVINGRTRSITTTEVEG